MVIEYEKENRLSCLLLNVPDTLAYLKKTQLILDYTQGSTYTCTVVTINVLFEKPAWVNLTLIDYLTKVFTKTEAERLITWHESMRWVCGLEQKFLKTERI
jgi:hypothetical protein